MLTHDNISLFDIVRLKDGRQGTIIEIYEAPELPISYEIEISDCNGITLDLFTVTIDEIADLETFNCALLNSYINISDCYNINVVVYQFAKKDILSYFEKEIGKNIDINVARKICPQCPKCSLP